MKIRLTICILFLATVLQAQRVPSAWYNNRIQQQVLASTEVMFHDVINPPAAARFYSYIVLAGYECLSSADTTLPIFQRMFKNYPVIRAGNNTLVDIQFASLYSMLETGKSILPSGYLLEDKQQQLLKAYRRVQANSIIIDSSVAFARRVAQAIIQYSRNDGYFKLSTLPRYIPTATGGYWKPTPPEYMSAVEPHWRTIRPFFLDSAEQFKPLPCEAFSVKVYSDFYRLAGEVAATGRYLMEEQKLIANFWDCNPFAVQFAGHMSVGLKKISPGGHWMGITGIACEQQHLSFAQTMLLHTTVACTLHDAFISCWDEKYRSNRIRPETAINKLMDEKWKPFLQTPPFPEYTSGHSVISTASAEILTYLLGDNIEFTDSTETYIGLPARHFPSFRKAAEEACISRLYGGIHYRDAIENGQEQGKRIAVFIISRLQKF